MTSYVAWNEIRAEHVGRAGGEAAVEAGKREVLAEVIGHRLAGIRRTRGLTQQQVADRMGVTKGRVSQIETRQDLWTGRPGPLRHRPRRPTPPGNLLRRRRHHCYRLTTHPLPHPATQGSGSPTRVNLTSLSNVIFLRVPLEIPSCLVGAATAVLTPAGILSSPR